MVWISRLYIAFVGIILTLTTGFGIAAFYPEPVRPPFPAKLQQPLAVESCYKTPEASKSPECLQLEEERNQASIEYDQKILEYDNVNANGIVINSDK